MAVENWLLEIWKSYPLHQPWILPFASVEVLGYTASGCFPKKLFAWNFWFMSRRRKTITTWKRIKTLTNRNNIIFVLSQTNHSISVNLTYTITMLGPQRPTPTRGVHDMAFTGTPRHNSHSIPNPSFRKSPAFFYAVSYRFYLFYFVF